MARGPKSKSASKSALQLQEDEEARRRAEVPIFSLEGLRVHKWKIAAIFVAALLVLVVLSVVLTSLTSAVNLDIASASSFERAKAGDRVNFTVSVRNTAQISSFAYEVHVLGMPPNWTAAAGEDVFPLKAGESRDVKVELATGASSPPEHDYPVVVKAIAKTGDLKSTLASKSLTLTVRVVSSDLRLGFETRVTQASFSNGAPFVQNDLTACGAAPVEASFALPVGANVSSASLALTYASSDPNATGFVAADVGDDGSLDGNLTLGPAALRLGLAASAFANYSAAHNGASSPLTVPVRFESCMNATSWGFNLTAPLLTFQRPLGANESLPVEVTNPNSETGEARLIARVTSREARPLSILVNLPNLPSGWETQPVLSSTPIQVAAFTSNTLDFTLQVAKRTPVGDVPLNFTACVQVNANDCISAPLRLDMPAAPFFTVETYVQPLQLKEVSRGRFVDTLLFAQNKGNQPTAFTIEMQGRPGLTFTFFDGRGNLSLTDEVPLALNESRPFALRVRAEPSAATSIYPVAPRFHNASNGIRQGDMFISINVVDAPASPRTLQVGLKGTVDFAGVTEGGLLFDTNIFSMLPLIDQKRRPTHPEYERPSTHGVTPYEFTLETFQDYTQTVHKGFEAYLDGMHERETIVLWLTPAQTPRTLQVGLKGTVDFAGVTEGGLLFDTNIFSMLPLIDQKRRPTHPEYERPSTHGVTPYEFTLETFQDYTQTVHKGFEAYLDGMHERETIVLWLTPAQTQLPDNAVLRDQTLVFEVKLSAIPNV